MSTPSASIVADTTTTGARAGVGVLVLLVAAEFLLIIDTAVVVVALPSIERDLGFSQDALSWVINGYALTFGGFLLLGGRLADQLGRKRMFLLGLTLFAIASLVGGLAQSGMWLVGARAAQGIGGAIVLPAALSLLTTAFAEGQARNRALGVWGAAGGAGGAVGVLLGGVLTSGLGWRWVLLINVPVVVVVVLFAQWVLTESRVDERTSSFDVPGAVSVTAGLGLLVYAVVGVQDSGWSSPVILAELAGAVVLLAAFIVIEARSRAPLIPLSIFRRPTLRGANVVCLLCFMALLAMTFFLSLYLQQILGYDALTAGLAYLPLSVSILLAATLAGRAVSRFGIQPTLLVGLVLFTAGLVWFSAIPAVGGSFVADVLGPSILAGLGFGGSVVPITIAAVSGVPVGEAGLASGLVNTTQQIGAALGLGILASIAAAHTTTSAADHAAALTDGYRLAYLVAAGFTGLAVIATLTLLRRRGADTTAQPLQRDYDHGV